ncbi:MAG: hypothetical protein ACRD1T_07905 [Acidimicrobiia bacterium]
MTKKGAFAAVGLAAMLFAAGSLGPFTPPRQAQAAKTPKALAVMALDRLRDARANADLTLLLEAEALLKRSLELDGSGNFEANVGMASLSNARHDFGGSVRWARFAIELNPYNASPYGLLGDALFELGHYGAAERAYQKMVDLRPDYASYVRASYAYQFRGDDRGALHAMKLALTSAGPIGETPAWIRHQLGDIYFGRGEIGKAARQNRIGTKLAPDYVPPTVGLAEVAIARGRLYKATALVKNAAAELPALEYLIKLGDLYRATGRPLLAAAQFEVVADHLATYRASGVLPDVDFILFYADHSLRPRQALKEGRFVYANRPTGAAADALGWILYRQGRPRIAWRYAKEAVASPPVSGSFYFHASKIAEAVGRDALGKRYLRDAIERKQSLTIPELIAIF